MYIVGIDIAKDSLDVAVVGGPQTNRGQFDNDQGGFNKLQRWLKKRGVQAAHIAMEATNSYWLELALCLDEQGYTVSVINPKLIKRHAEATMQRNKTDPQDALTIADYCAKHRPDSWVRPSEAYLALRAMTRHLQALKADRQRERNRRQSGIANQQVTASIDAHLAFLAAQIEALSQRINEHIDQNPDLKRDKELLLTIPGIGAICAAVFLAEVPDVAAFAQASQVAAFAGLTPGQRDSGTSLRGRGRLVKSGNSHLRAVLFMPSLSAHCWNPIIAALKERLQARGKNGLTINVAIMRKLVHLCYGVLKSGLPFDPNHVANVQFPT
jgi:transposase